jgi:TatD DNase family protein
MTGISVTGSQLSLAKKHDLPLFLHSRAAHDDFTSILVEEGFAKDARGVVHSFTGSLHEAKQYVSDYKLPSGPCAY